MTTGFATAAVEGAGRGGAAGSGGGGEEEEYLDFEFRRLRRRPETEEEDVCFWEEEVWVRAREGLSPVRRRGSSEAFVFEKKERIEASLFAGGREWRRR